MKKLNESLIYIKNFLRYLTVLEKIEIVLSILFFIGAVIVLLIITSTLVSQSITALCGIFPINILIQYLKKFEKDLNVLKKRQFHLDIIWGIYGLRKKTIDRLSNLDSETDEWGVEMVTIPDADASNLVSGVISMKNSIETLLNNNCISFEEERTLTIVRARINDFLEKNPNIPIMEEGFYFVKPIQIDKKWITEIKYLIEEQYSVETKQKKMYGMFKPCDISIEKMKDKYDFGYIS